MMRRSILLVVLGLAVAGTAVAGSKIAPINKDGNRLALHGYDAVTYFEADKPLPGSPSFSYLYMGATWQFVSLENRKKFAADRDKYMPQYGGYCAKAVSENNTADVDPLSYKIVDGKLYLNYDAKVQKIWEKDIPGRIAKADKYWPEMLASK